MTWTQALAEVMVTKMQMWEMSLGKESMRHFSNVVNK